MTLSKIISDITLECAFMQIEINNLKTKKWFRPYKKINELEKKIINLMIRQEYLQNLESILKKSELVVKTKNLDNLDEPKVRELGFCLTERCLNETKQWVHTYQLYIS